jgi:SagB-type dehydrogenase family enzyme
MKPGKKIIFIFFISILILSMLPVTSCRVIKQAGSYIRYSILKKINKEVDILDIEEEIVLPEPVTDSNVSLEEALEIRRSIRDFSETDIELDKISQLLWAGQGITQEISGYRTSPSAGALYPLDLYLIKEDGLYHYQPVGHRLEKLIHDDLRKKLSKYCLDQSSVSEAPVSIIITAVYERTTVKYGERGLRYVHMEAGHSCQNILLQAAALGLGAVPVGAFYDDPIKKLLDLPSFYAVLYVIPVGYPE